EYNATRALRVQDGATVNVPNFHDIYVKPPRVAVQGRNVFLTEVGGEKPILRLYDVQTGKDVWRKEFPANSLVVRSEVPGLAGIVEPGGKLTVYDLATGKEAFQAAVEPEHLDKVEQLTLFRDRSNYYLAFKGPSDPAVVVGEANPSFQGP